MRWSTASSPRSVPLMETVARRTNRERTPMTWADGDEARRRTDGARLHSYRFAPRDRRGLVFGVRTGQAAVVAVMLVLVVGELRVLHGSVRALVAVQLVVGFAVAFLPVRGRPLEQWLPTV